MIIIENIILSGVEYRKTHSDSNLQIRKIGTEEIYEEAIDLLDKDFTYEETNMPILIEEEILEEIPENQGI